MPLSVTAVTGKITFGGFLLTECIMHYIITLPCSFCMLCGLIPRPRQLLSLTFSSDDQFSIVNMSRERFPKVSPSGVVEEGFLFLTGQMQVPMFKQQCQSTEECIPLLRVQKKITVNIEQRTASVHTV